MSLSNDSTNPPVTQPITPLIFVGKGHRGIVSYTATDPLDNIPVQHTTLFTIYGKYGVIEYLYSEYGIGRDDYCVVEVETNAIIANYQRGKLIAHYVARRLYALDFDFSPMGVSRLAMRTMIITAAETEYMNRKIGGAK